MALFKIMPNDAEVVAAASSTLEMLRALIVLP